MSQTVVGLFKSHEEAQNVKHELVNDGYDAANIQVVGKDGNIQSPREVSPAEEEGFGDKIGNFFRSLVGADTEDEKKYTEAVSSGGSFLAVTVSDDRADEAAAALERYGARDVDERSGKTDRSMGDANLGRAADGQKMNVVEEQLNVGKRAVERGGVRIYSHVTERPVEEQITLREEHVRVERRPVDRAATEADFNAFEEGTIELHETAEEAVVSKTARVVEEVVVGKNVSERQKTVKDTVRRTDVEVEQMDSPRQERMANRETSEPGYRDHFDTNYASSGASYDTYSPAYLYGQDLANNSRYSDSDWMAVEPSAQEEWSRRGTGTWEEMKSAVRHGWDKVRGTSTARARG